MRIVFMGNNDRGVRCLKALADSGENVVGVAAHPDRKAESWYGSVKDEALRLGLEVFQPERINAPESVEKLRSWAPDAIILVGYTQIIGPEILGLAPNGCLNLHGGKLPEYRGGSPLNWQIINDEPKIGLSIIMVDKSIDTGDIVAQAEFEITDQDDINTVVERCNEIFPELLIKTVKGLETGTLNRKQQDPGQGAAWTKRYPRDGRIRWEWMTARQVFNLTRALTRPYPGAFCFLGDRKLHIWKCSLVPETYRGMPGRTASVTATGTIVTALDRGIMVREAQIEGEDIKNAAEILNKPGVDLL